MIDAIGLDGFGDSGGELDDQLGPMRLAMRGCLTLPGCEGAELDDQRHLSWLIEFAWQTS